MKFFLFFGDTFHDQLILKYNHIPIDIFHHLNIFYILQI